MENAQTDRDLIFRFPKHEPNQKSSTLCFFCETPAHKCSWMDRFEPVKGWTAVQTHVAMKHPENIVTGSISYHVSRCPLFHMNHRMIDIEAVKLERMLRGGRL